MYKIEQNKQDTKMPTHFSTYGTLFPP